MNFISKLEKSKSFWFLIFISFGYFILRLPSLFEPYWYADEGIYQAVATLLRAGHPLYSGAWENKPPLLLLIYALFNSDQFLIRGASLIFGLISVWFFFFIAKRLFNESNKIAAVITSIYAFVFGTRLIEGNIANAENFMLLPILIGAYLLLSSQNLTKNKQFKIILLAGLILSLAFLTKIVAIFDFLAFGVFLFISSGENFKQTFKEKLLPFFSGLIIPTIITALYFLVTNNLKDFLDAFFIQNVGYVGLGNHLLIPQGLLYLKIILLFVFCIFLYLKRKSFSKTFLFVNLWFAFSLFDVFFSQRPYTHYLIMLLPSFCLMIGLILWEKIGRYFTILFLTISFILIYQTFGFKGELVSYYANFSNYCSGKISTATFQSFFDRTTPRDYELSRFIRMHTSKKDSVFIWGNNAQVYKLADKTPIMRYVVAYHITNYPTGVSEMKTAISTKKPKLVIIMPNIPAFPFALSNYIQTVNVDGALIYEKIF